MVDSISEAERERLGQELLAAIMNTQEFDAAKMENLLDRGASVQACCEWGLSALSWASIRGYKEMAVRLIDQGADINSRDNNLATPLILATVYGHKDIVELLIARGADPEARGSDGRTARDWAILKDNPPIRRIIEAAQTAWQERLLTRRRTHFNLGL